MSWMRARACLPLAYALVLLAGCGSASGPSGSSGPPSSDGSRASATQSHATGGLGVSTTPKFIVPSRSEPVRSGLIEVAYRDFAIAPDTLRAKVGSTIRWTNYDATEHNVTSEGGPQRFAGKVVGEGATFELKLTRPGVIHYECTIHPAAMNGSIEVVR
jgi:plastocyanin